MWQIFQVLENTHFMYKHTKEEISCEKCEKLFKSKANMRKHVNSVHGEDISCLSCKKSFPSKTYLKQHQKNVQSSKNEFICCYCEKAFNFKKSLKKHEKHSCKGIHEKL